jgi:hypothetical protein
MMPVAVGDEQRRDLRDQPVTHGEQRELTHRVARGEPQLHHPDGHAADEVDRGDDQAGDRIALHELRGTVHGAVEVRLRGDPTPALLRLDVGDQPGVEVRVDRHLLAGHRVQGEARGDLRHAARRRW